MAKAIHMMMRVREEARRSPSTAQRSLSRWPIASISTTSLSSTCATARLTFELELTINKGRTEPYEIGNGYGHLAFCVDDLDAARSRCTAAGLGAQGHQGDGAPGPAVRPLLLHRGPGRLQDRGAAALGTLPLTADPLTAVAKPIYRSLDVH